MSGSELFLLSMLVVAVVVASFLLFVYWKASKALARYSDIQDVEGHKAKCERDAATAAAQCQQSAAERQKIQAQIATYQQTVAKYTDALGKFNSLADLESRISVKQGELDHLVDSIETASSVTELVDQARYYENYVAELRSEVGTLEETRQLQQFGYYDPRYDFEDSERCGVPDYLSVIVSL